MTEGIIFDYGGTLDTGGCHWGRYIWHAFERHDIPVTFEQFADAYVYGERTLGRNPIVQTDYTFRKTLDVKLCIEFENLQGKGLLGTNNFTIASTRSAILNDLYDSVKKETAKSREVLLKLKAQHSLVLVSNFYGNLQVVLEEFHLSDIFQEVVESAVVGVRKPDPHIFALGVDALGMEPKDVTVVGDSISKDMNPAKSIGCNTVWLCGEAWDNKSLDVKCVDRTITSLIELI